MAIHNPLTATVTLTILYAAGTWTVADAIKKQNSTRMLRTIIETKRQSSAATEDQQKKLEEEEEEEEKKEANDLKQLHEQAPIACHTEVVGELNPAVLHRQQ